MDWSAHIRENEVGTPYHIIVDEKTLETGILSLQDRDTSAMVKALHTLQPFKGSKSIIQTLVGQDSVSRLPR